MIQDPSEELLALVRRSFPDPPSDADRSAARLVRRRFGLSLPPPFAEVAPDGDVPPVRAAVEADGTAAAAVKWRSWQVGYRGVVDDDFLDHRAEVHPSAAWWSQRAAWPPSRRHRLLVLGRPGEVHGFCDVGPYREAGGERGDDVADPTGDHGGQVCSLYVDPSGFRRGWGAALLAAGVEHLGEMGLTDLRLWVVDRNRRARAFYESQGWEADGAVAVRPFPDLTVTEVRYRRT